MARRQRRKRLSGVNLADNGDESQTQTPAKIGSLSPDPDAQDAAAPFVDLGANDDEAEKEQKRKSRARRRSLAITPARNNNDGSGPSSMAVVSGNRQGGAMASGGGANSSHSRSRHKSRTRARTRSRGRSRGRSPGAPPLPQIVLNPNELTEIYRNCISMVKHNKINQKNAWNLDLVEHMGDIVNKLDNQTNFQRASHTIDAASKIYGYRVDSVHDETYKILGAIHQSGDQPGGANGSNDNNNRSILDDMDENNNRKNKRKRMNRNRNVGKNTLAIAEGGSDANGNNVGNSAISEKLKNMIVEVDPLFHKTATAFDEGGAKGLLMNQLTVQNGCEIVFDSTTKMENNINDASNENTNDNDVEPSDEEVQREQEWIDSLFVQKDETSEDPSNETNEESNDSSKQSSKRNKDIDFSWLQTTDICPILDDFEKEILDLDENSRSKQSQNVENDNIESGRTERQLDFTHIDGPGASDMMLDGSDSDHPSDDNIMLPEITDDGGLPTFNDISAPDLFAEDFENSSYMNNNNGDNSNLSLNNNDIEINRLMMDPNSSVLNDSQSMQFKIDSSQLMRQLEQNDLNNLNNNNNIDNDNNNGNINGSNNNKQVFARGINLIEMNNVIEKLEHSELESTTTFWDPKKHGNWAGPDQWYYRRYLMTVQKHQNYLEDQAKLLEKERKSNLDKEIEARDAEHNLNKHSNDSNSDVNPASMDNEDAGDSASLGDSNNNNNNNNNNENVGDEEAPPPKKRRKLNKDATLFDFMSIARGNWVDSKKFDQFQRSHGTLTESVIKKNLKNMNTLPKDYRYHPSMFIKLFHKPNYSVWKHHKKQWHIKLMQLQREQRLQQQQQSGDNNVSDVNNISMNNNNNNSNLLASDMNAEDVLNMQKAASFVNGNNNGNMFDNSDELSPDFYDYNNPNDISNFVPNLIQNNGDNNDGNDNNENIDGFNIGIGMNNDISGNNLLNMNDHANDNPFEGFHNSSFQLVDAPNQVNKIQLKYSRSTKKVDVRKLKLKMWEAIVRAQSLEPSESDAASGNNSNNNNKTNENTDPNSSNDMDVENSNENNNNNNSDSKHESKNTFQNTLNSLEGELGARILSTISVPFTFIALLHLANEKNLQLVPKNEDMADFAIKFADPNSIEELEAANVRQVMILGGNSDN